MGNHVGLRLSRLIKERAYRSGTLQTLQKEADELTRLLTEKTQAVQEKTEAIEELDKQIRSLSAIDPEDIRPIKAMPRKLRSPHGAFRRELIDFLQKQGGAGTSR